MAHHTGQTEGVRFAAGRAVALVLLASVAVPGCRTAGLLPSTSADRPAPADPSAPVVRNTTTTVVAGTGESTEPSPLSSARPRTLTTLPASSGAVVTPSGVVLPVVGGGPGAWTVRTPCEREATVARGAFVPRADVVIDPGHGGSEPGAVGPGGLQEKAVNLAVAQRVAEHLRAAGRQVVLTRTGDYRVTLRSRAEIARRLAATAFVSIHFNAEPDGPATKPGSETYYQRQSAESKRLAGLAYEEVLSALRPYEAAWVADSDAGAKYRTNVEGHDYYGILRHSAGVTTALLELAFISNAAEERLIRTDAVQDRLAAAVAAGVTRFLDTDDPGAGFTVPYDRPSPAGGNRSPGNCVDPDFG